MSILSSGRGLFSRFVSLVGALVLVLGIASVAPGRASASPGVGSTTGAAAPPAPSVKAHTVSLDGYSFKVDGKRVYLWSGEFHYFRLPSPSLWVDVFQKMKAAGFNTVSLYFDWGYHSPAPGVYDFTGVRDVDQLLNDAQQAGLYVIARPAPYINAEVDGGGLPGWLTTKKEQNRSADPNFLKYADQWLSHIDKIIARHQLTNGTGSVIAYQVENEYYNGSAAGRKYMKALEDKARADGITVPLTGNNNGTFNSGVAALDVDGPDSYPQGFNCSNPTKWNGVPNISYDHPAGNPLYTPEFQGGAFDPWGGPGYDKCEQLINDQFANVFYKQNIAVGATAQSFYMTYGGTNWAWLGMPENYTSYDYGAAIRETRQLTPKYQQEKLIGDFTQSVAPLTKTDAINAAAPDNSAIVDTARKNPDTGTQFHVLRHANSTSTSVDKTHISIDFNAQATKNAAYTYDDTNAALKYSAGWTPVANQSYTSGDYKNTETFSNTKGAAVTVPFTGTGVRWIGSRTNNHGYADVSIDGGTPVRVDDSGSGFQQTIFSASGLKDGQHSLKIVVDGAHSAGSTDNFVSIDAVDVPVKGSVVAPTYPTVPQQPGTAITLNGRDSQIIVADYKLGQTQLQYSTSEIMTQARIGAREVAVLYGNKGSAGETVLNFKTRPTVTSTGGPVQQTWDPATGDLRLNYTHQGLTRVQVTEPGQAPPLLLLLADKATAETFWTQNTAAGPVLVRGTHLLRTATMNGATLALTGDNAADNSIEVFTGAHTITWNGAPVSTQTSATGGQVGVIPTAAAVTLPKLDTWKQTQGSPETQPGFNDSHWQVADKTTTNSVTGITTLPVLYADDYGFHTGSTWYRGRFPTTGKATGIHLVSDSGGKAQAFSAWLNGTFLGSSTTGSADFTFPSGALVKTGDNVVSVLTVNMGHEEDYNSTNGNKTARGLTTASLVGAPLSSVTWRIQGVRGGENLIDPVRGTLSTGGLYGERAGWSLPGFPDSTWSSVSLPTSSTRAGVSWYRDEVSLNLPKGQDTSVGLTIADSPTRQYRAEIFVNGWDMGNYVNYLGPQHSFPIPNGILNTHGKNSIAIAVWNLDGKTGGLGTVSLTNYGSYTSSLKVTDNNSPRYNLAKYAMPGPVSASAVLQVPGSVAAGEQFTATTTVTVPAGKPAATGVTASLTAPTGWTVGTPTPARVDTIAPGTSAMFTWKVTTPSTVAKVSDLTTTVHAVQGNRPLTLRDERIVGYIPPTPPKGVSQVSNLPWLSSTNGYGPVERNTSVGGQAAGDGQPITLGGTVYRTGIGTNSPSDVKVYLGGQCTQFTATVGVDDETKGKGTVTFSVVGDGKTLATTPVITPATGPQKLSVNVTGAQVLDLVVGDGGDNNFSDHGDWANAQLTCSGPTAPVTTTVNVELQAHDNSILPLGSASYYTNGRWHPITAKDVNNHAILQTSLAPGTYSFAVTYNGTREQKEIKVTGTAQTVYFHTALVNVWTENHKSTPISGGVASYYAAGAYHPVTTKNVNNPKIVQAEMLPGTYSFEDVYRGTREQKKFTVLEPNANNGAHAVQSVYFHTALVNVWTESQKSTPISGGSASYYADGTYHPVTTKDVNNPDIVQAEMLPGTYTFQDTYHGTRQQKKFTVLEPNANNGAHATQSVYFHFAG